MNSIKSQYSKVAQLLHWLIAGLIVGQFMLAKLAERAEQNESAVQQLALLANHKSIGMTILALALVRLVWRLLNSPPALPVTMPTWQRIASLWTHRVIYFLLFFIPLTGWLMSSATAYSVSWFNVFAFPDLVGSDKDLAGLFHQAHEFSTKVLFLIVVIHVSAALKHHYFDKDEILFRMANKTGYLIFFFSVGLLVLFLAQPVSKAKSAAGIEQLSTSAHDNGGSDETQQLSSLVAWDIDYENSFIKFNGDQAGAPFEGRWQRWQADIKFAEEHLNESAFDVTIEVGSVASDDQERDEYIVAPDFFDVANYSEVRFLARDFQINAQGYFEADGQLTMKGLTKQVKFIFSVEEVGGRQTLIGESKLDRLAWSIGIGDWSDPTWIGQDVGVNVKITKRDL